MHAGSDRRNPWVPVTGYGVHWVAHYDPRHTEVNMFLSTRTADRLRSRLRPRPRPRLSMLITDGVLTIANTGRCPAEVTDLAIVPVGRFGAARRFDTGSVLADLGGTTVAVRGDLTLLPGDSLRALIGEHMIVRPVARGASYDVRGRATVTGRSSAQFSGIASFHSLARQKPAGADTAERELRARLMWGFS